MQGQLIPQPAGHRSSQRLPKVLQGWSRCSSAETWAGTKVYAKTTGFHVLDERVARVTSPDTGSPLAITFSRLRIFLLRSSSKLVYCDPAMS